jgi:hypothetical protein
VEEEVFELLIQRYGTRMGLKLFVFLYAMARFGGKEKLIEHGYSKRTFFHYQAILREGGILPKYFDVERGEFLSGEEA